MREEGQKIETGRGGVQLATKGDENDCFAGQQNRDTIDRKYYWPFV